MERIGSTDILVVHVAEQLDLPERALGVDLVVERVGDLLDRHLLPRLRVERRAVIQTQNPKSKPKSGRRRQRNGREGGANEPDDAVGALADGEDGGLVLGGDLEHVPEDVVLDEPPAMAQRRLDVLHHPRPCPRPRRRSRSRRLLPAAGLRHLRVRRLRPGVHGRIRIWIATRRWRWRR
ncbi:Os06g0154550, partial [Oryza sativa Japonica Group]